MKRLVIILGVVAFVASCRREAPSGGEPGKTGAPPAPAATEKKVVPGPTPATLATQNLTYLDELEPKDVQSGARAPRMGKAWEGSPIIFGGTEMKHGIGGLAPFSMVFAVPPGTKAFQATIGFRDGECMGSVVYEVLDDKGNSLARIPLRDGQKPVAISVPLGDTKLVTLNAGDAGDGHDCDNVNWGGCAFVGSGAPAAAAKPEQGKPATEQAKPATAQAKPK